MLSTDGSKLPTTVVEARVVFPVVVNRVAEVEASVVLPVTPSVPPIVVLPVIDAVPVATKLVVEMLDVEALARLVCPCTVRVPWEVKEFVNIPSVARSKAVKKEPVEVALVNDADTAFSSVAKKLDEEALERVVLVAIRLDIVVVAKVVVPTTVNVPVEVAPDKLDRKEVFSTQLLPFQ